MRLAKNVTRWSVVFTALLSLIACKQPDVPEKSIRPALVMTIGQVASEGALSLVGEIQPRYSAVQGFRVSGKIIKRYVDVGDHVKKGQLLARIDGEDASLSVQANESAILAGKASLNLAASELQRQEQLLEQKFISPAALDQYQTNYALAKAKLAQLHAQSEVSKNQSSYTQLVADRSGVVNMIRAEPGQVVGAGEPVATIVSPDELELHIPVAERSIEQVKLNQRVSLTLWSDQSKQYVASVREIAPVADPVTRTYLVKLAIKHADSALKMGMTATAYIPTARDAALLIPSAAVVKHGGETIVWQVTNEQTVTALPVVVEAYSEEGALITSGLQAGQTIVIAGAHVLTEQQAIQPVERKF